MRDIFDLFDVVVRQVEDYEVDELFQSFDFEDFVVIEFELE
jgi:hypothetical protein